MSKYRLITKVVPPLENNCYILIDNATKQAAVIDPGSSAAEIAHAAQEAGAEIAMIINTHGHWDHIGGNAQLGELTGAPILIHEQDEPMLARPSHSLALLFHDESGEGGEAAQLLHNGDQLPLGELTLSVLHTPGHTPGCICLLCEDLLFTGDTLFQLSCGRTDLNGGDAGQMLASLSLLARLEGDYQVLPGHGPASNLDYERKYNPYIPR